MMNQYLIEAISEDTEIPIRIIEKVLISYLTSIITYCVLAGSAETIFGRFILNEEEELTLINTNDKISEILKKNLDGDELKTMITELIANG